MPPRCATRMLCQASVLGDAGSTDPRCCLPYLPARDKRRFIFERTVSASSQIFACPRPDRSSSTTRRVLTARFPFPYFFSPITITPSPSVRTRSLRAPFASPRPAGPAPRPPPAAPGPHPARSGRRSSPGACSVPRRRSPPRERRFEGTEANRCRFRRVGGRAAPAPGPTLSKSGPSAASPSETGESAARSACGGGVPGASAPRGGGRMGAGRAGGGRMFPAAAPRPPPGAGRKSARAVGA